MTELAFEAIGTVWRISYSGADEANQEVSARIYSRIEQFDKAYSRFRSDSLITAMAGSAGTYELPEDARELLEVYEKLYTVTKGAFTPLIGSTLSAAGYDATYSFVSKEISAPPLWEDTLRYEFPSLTLRTPALLDFGAGGKGYLVDIVARLIEEAGCEAYVVDAGGDMRIKSSIATRVALEDPHDTEHAIGIATLSSGSVCGSSGNRRAWQGYNHLIDPATLQSPDTIAATWVTAPTALVADSLATCLFFVPASELLDTYPFEYLIMYPDRSIERSKDFPAELFVTDSHP